MATRDKGVPAFDLRLRIHCALRFIVELSTTNMVIQSTDNAVPVQTQPWIQVAVTWDGTLNTAQNPGPASAAHLFANGVQLTNASETDAAGNLDVSKGKIQIRARFASETQTSARPRFFFMEK